MSALDVNIQSNPLEMMTAVSGKSVFQLTTDIVQFCIATVTHQSTSAQLCFFLGISAMGRSRKNALTWKLIYGINTHSPT